MSAASERAHVDEAYRNLKALEAIEANPNISQRELARSMDVALGMANACVRTLVRKGLIKIRGESNRSITYHLTKEGRTQKARLAVEWTRNTIDFYAQARNRIARQLSELAGAGYGQLALYGADEAGELVSLLAPQAGISLRAVFASHDRRIADVLAGVPVEPLPACRTDIGALLVTTIPSDEELESIAAALPAADVVLLTGETLLSRTEEPTCI